MALMGPEDRPWLGTNPVCVSCGADGPRLYAWGSADRDERVLCRSCALREGRGADVAMLDEALRRDRAAATIRPRGGRRRHN